MKWLSVILILVGFFLNLSNTFGQPGESPIRIYGYFQNIFQHQSSINFKTTHPQFVTNEESTLEENSFDLQQLNLFLSKNLARNWKAFVNFEILNNFSSQRQWGAFNLEEAWVRYKPSDYFNLKLGLMIPVFNNLNEIKNRTPLLPYIFRPIDYETSFRDEINADESAPARAFVQASGIIPKGRMKFDYALYLGNSPNVARTVPGTGKDTTNTFLIGSRVGFRLKDLKIGVSATHEKLNLRQLNSGIATYAFIYNEVSRYRIGSDLSFNIGPLFFEGEFIKVIHDDISEIRIDGIVSNVDHGNINIDRKFYYGTLGYLIKEKLFIYVSYSYLKSNYIFITSQIPILRVSEAFREFFFPNAGIAYHLNDKITIKGQFLPVKIKDTLPFPGVNETIKNESKFNVVSVAVSVFF